MRYGIKTNHTPEEVIQEALEFLGPEGNGLEVISKNECCISFQGGGGHVTVTVTEEQDQTDVDIVTEEWDYPVKQWIQKLA